MNNELSYIELLTLRNVLMKDIELDCRVLERLAQNENGHFTPHKTPTQTKSDIDVNSATVLKLSRLIRQAEAKDEVIVQAVPNLNTSNI